MRRIAILFLFFSFSALHAQQEWLLIKGTLRDHNGIRADHPLRLVIKHRRDTIISILSDSSASFHFIINYNRADHTPLALELQETDEEKLKPFALGPCPWNCNTMYAFLRDTIQPGYAKDTYFLPVLISPWLVDYHFPPQIYFKKNNCDLNLDTNDSTGKINQMKLLCFSSFISDRFGANIITYSMANSRKSRKDALLRANAVRDYFIKHHAQKARLKIIVRNYAEIYPDHPAAPDPFVSLQFFR